MAWNWAKNHTKAGKAGEPLAVLGALIRLGRCFDLVDPRNIDTLDEYYAMYVEEMRAAGEELPKNNKNLAMRLDCAVLRRSHASLPSSAHVRLPKA